MITVLARNWGWVALRGVVALLFGLLTLFNPLITLAALIVFFGAYALADGLLTIVAAVANRHDEPHWISLLICGLAGIAAGVVTFAMPRVTTFALLLLIVAWAIVTGIAEIVAAIRLRKIITGEWLLGLAGLLSIAFGVFIVLRPAAGALTVVLWIGAWATAVGIMLIALSLRLRRWNMLQSAGRIPHPA